MNIVMKLTFDGLVRALRFKALAAEETAAFAKQRPAQSDMDISGGETDDAWRGSTAKGAV
ncbi:hypothetical protein AAIB41_01745 [Brucella sp. BE17]|uniref:hypothetical protein n=1 Tax=Brucella sp. BE17 TaxID=3142977 RepID=UPI0031BA365C